MKRSTRPSFPSAPSEPSLRRLGVGSPGGGGDRPLRAQVVVAVVAAAILIAVPLYLLRRPSTDEAATARDAGEAEPAADAGARSQADAAAAREASVRLSAAQKVKCSASKASKGQEGILCDALTFFEKSLADSIRKNTPCAPKTGQAGTLNYVLEVDFRRRRVNVFPGASGSWRGPQARRATECVERSLPPPSWESVPHQYNFYMIAIMASYPPPAGIPGPVGAPVFE